MGFRIKGTDTILQKLITFVSVKTDKLTDFNPGSAIRTLLESVSLQMEEFYYDLKQAVQFAIKNSGYHAFGFTKNAARRATGKVNIFFMDSLRSPLVIKKGTEFHTGSTRLKRVYFVSTEDMYINTGAQSAIIPIACTEFGEVGNVQVGEISKMSIGMANIAYISNLEDFTDGKEEESEIDREIRFREYVHTLQRGTAEAVAYGIKTVPGVAGVWVDDNYIGYMYAYIHDKHGNLSEELKQQVEKAVFEYRSGGIEVEIRPIIKKVVDLSINVTYREGISAQKYDYFLEGLIEKYINTLKTSEDLYMSTLITTINDTFRDVIAYIDVGDNKDVTTLNNELLRSGKIYVNRDDEQ